MFLSVEIGEEMREYPEYDDHNSTLATKWPKNAIPTIKSQQIQAIKPAATTNISKKALRKTFLLVEIVKDTGKYLGNHDHNG